MSRPTNIQKRCSMWSMIARWGVVGLLLCGSFSPLMAQQSGVLMPLVRYRAFTDLGVISAGATLLFQLSGTTTNSPSYTTQARTVAHAQPVVADAGGLFPAIYLNPNLTYRVTLKDSLGNIIFGPQDGVSGGGGVSGDLGWANVKQFGAVGNGSANDTAAIQAAIDSLPTGAVGQVSQGGTVYFPPGSYRLPSTGLTIRKNVHLLGPGGGAVTISNNGGTATPLVTTVSGGGGLCEISELSFQTSNSGDIAIQLLGVDRCHIHDNQFYVGTAGQGTAIQINSNGVAGAYTHRIDHNIITNPAIGIQLNGGAGGQTSNIIESNHIISDAGIQEVSGCTCGSNQYLNNLIQARTPGTGVGVDLSGSGGDATVMGNYLEGYLSCVTIRAGGVRNKIYAGSWETCTTKITDLSAVTGKGGSVVDLMDNFIALGNTAPTAAFTTNGDPTVRTQGLSTFDSRGGSARGYSLVNGTSAIGEFAIRDDTGGTYPLLVDVNQLVKVLNGLRIGTALAFSATAPTVASGCGTTPTIASGTSTSFRLNVGTGGVATGCVLTLPATTTAWNCDVDNLTALAANRGDQRTVQTASSTTTVTIQNQTISTGAALAWTASDIIKLQCAGS